MLELGSTHCWPSPPQVHSGELSLDWQREALLPCPRRQGGGLRRSVVQPMPAAKEPPLSTRGQKEGRLSLVCKVAPCGQMDEQGTNRWQCQHFPQALRVRVQFWAQSQAPLKIRMWERWWPGLLPGGIRACAHLGTSHLGYTEDHDTQPSL